MLKLITFVHIICGATIIGILVASFIYIASSIKQNNLTLMQYAIQTSFFGDYLVFPMILVQFFTGALMVKLHHLSFNLPWIIAAHIALTFVTLLWLCLLLIKYKNYKRTKPFIFKKCFYALNILMVVTFILIIHDAVTQSTGLFFWR